MSRLLRVCGSALVVATLVLAWPGPALASPPGGTAPPVVAEPPAPKQDLNRIRAQAFSSAQTNSLFVPITPCRVVDTRAGTGTGKTKFGNGTTRSYAVSGSTGFEAQGGKAGGCGIPVSATGVTATVVAVAPSAGGYVQAWPAGAGQPLATVLNYGKFTMGAGTTVAIRPGSSPSLSVRNAGSTTHLVLDVTGYYLPQMQGMVSPGNADNAPIYAGSSRIISATNPSAGVYQVKFDGNITYCTPMVNTYNAGAGVYGAAYAFSSDTATVYTWYLSSTTHLEVPYSFYFYITVAC